MANIPSGTWMREKYLYDMRLCQRWAVLLLKFFERAGIVEEFESTHNYIGDDNMIRKGGASRRKRANSVLFR